MIKICLRMLRFTNLSRMLLFLDQGTIFNLIILDLSKGQHGMFRIDLIQSPIYISVDFMFMWTKKNIVRSVEKIFL